MAPSDTDSTSSWIAFGKKIPRSEIVFLCQVLILYTVGLVSIHFTTVNNSSVQLGKYPFLNVRLALLSRTLSPGENLHDFVGPFLPEFIDRVFQKFLKAHDMHFFTTYNEETKASIVERFNRTLKTNQDVEVFHMQRNSNLRRRSIRDGRILEVRVVFLEKLLKYSVGKFSSFVCL
jgi:hypothetical protein